MQRHHVSVRRVLGIVAAGLLLSAAPAFGQGGRVPSSYANFKDGLRYSKLLNNNPREIIRADLALRRYTDVKQTVKAMDSLPKRGLFGRVRNFITRKSAERSLKKSAMRELRSGSPGAGFEAAEALIETKTKPLSRGELGKIVRAALRGARKDAKAGWTGDAQDRAWAAGDLLRTYMDAEKGAGIRTELSIRQTSDALKKADDKVNRAVQTLQPH